MSADMQHRFEHVNYAIREFFDLYYKEFLFVVQQEPSFIDKTYAEIWDNFVEYCYERLNEEQAEKKPPQSEKK
jgi:hypothetical protein